MYIKITISLYLFFFISSFSSAQEFATIYISNYSEKIYLEPIPNLFMIRFNLDENGVSTVNPARLAHIRWLADVGSSPASAT